MSDSYSRKVYIDGQRVRISKRTGKPVRPYHINPNVDHPQYNNFKDPKNCSGWLEKLPEGKNQKYIKHVLECQQIGVGVDKNDIEDMKQRFIKYLEVCAKNDMKVGNLAAYCAIGLTKDIVFDWEHGCSRTPEHQAFIRFVKSVIAAYRESALSEGEINPVLGMFWQKSFDGLNEMTEVEASNLIEGNTDQMTAEQIADKYQDLLPE